MHILDTDITTLAFYGKNVNVKNRFDSHPASERLAITIITRAEILMGRFDSLRKASRGAQWIEAESRLRVTEDWLSGLEVIGIGAAAD